MNKMARNNNNRGGRNRQEGMRDDQGRFTEKGAEKFGREGGQASSRKRSGESRGRNGGSQQQNQRNKSSSRNH